MADKHDENGRVSAAMWTSVAVLLLGLVTLVIIHVNGVRGFQDQLNSHRGRIAALEQQAVDAKSWRDRLEGELAVLKATVK